MYNYCTGILGNVFEIQSCNTVPLIFSFKSGDSMGTHMQISQWYIARICYTIDGAEYVNALVGNLQ